MLLAEGQSGAAYEVIKRWISAGPDNVRARWALAASQAPAAPILSLSSTTIRSAGLRPTPEIWESDLTSPLATAPRKATTLMPLNTLRAILGPMPLTVLMSKRNISRSAGVAKP